MQTPEEIDKFIKQLAHRDKALREDAEAQLLKYGNVASPYLIHAIREAYKKYLSRDYRYRRISDKIESVAILCASAFVAIFIWSNQQTFVTPLAVIILILLTLIGIITQNTRRVPRYVSGLYNLLTKIKSPQMVGIILEMHATDHIWMSKKAIELLELHTQQILPIEWTNYSHSQRKAFYRITAGCGVIKQSSCQDFALAALKALEQIGDAEAIPTVERVAKKGRSEKVRQAAHECLPYLQTRREEQSTRQTLLRASEATGGKEELLRVPAKANISESEQLLRVPKGEE